MKKIIIYFYIDYLIDGDNVWFLNLIGEQVINDYDDIYTDCQICKNYNEMKFGYKICYKNPYHF